MVAAAGRGAAVVVVGEIVPCMAKKGGNGNATPKKLKVVDGLGTFGVDGGGGGGGFAAVLCEAIIMPIIDGGGEAFVVGGRVVNALAKAFRKKPSVRFGRVCCSFACSSANAVALSSRANATTRRRVTVILIARTCV